MKTKEEVKGCFNCDHEKMNHKSCNASKPCLKGSQWTKRIAPPQEVERAKGDVIKAKALRKKGTDKWYYFATDGRFYPSRTIDIEAGRTLTTPPSDAELVDIEIRVIEPNK